MDRQGRFNDIPSLGQAIAATTEHTGLPAVNDHLLLSDASDSDGKGKRITVANLFPVAPKILSKTAGDWSQITVGIQGGVSAAYRLDISAAEHGLGNPGATSALTIDVWDTDNIDHFKVNEVLEMTIDSSSGDITIRTDTQQVDPYYLTPFACKIVIQRINSL